MKNYSTYAALLTGTPDEAMLLDEWLDERSAERDVAIATLDKEIAGVTQDGEKLAAACDEYDADVQPGQIRILSKRFTGDSDVIPYIAVLEKQDGGMWLIAPFSQYSTPATSGEMATGIDHFGLRVVQAWNGRAVQDRLLEKSFLFGKMDESLRVQALALFRHEVGGWNLPVGFSVRRGSAVVVDADPRNDYVAEAVARLRPLSTAVKATERFRAEATERKIEQQRLLDELAKNGDVFSPDIESWEAARKAAGKRQPIVRSYEVGDCQLDMEYSPEDGDVNLTFYGKDDEKTTDCDGFGVFGKGLEFLGVFRQGTFTSSRERLGKVFEITDREGQRVAKPRLVDDGMKL